MTAIPTGRATHEPSRKRLGLAVGIAIALAGCDGRPETAEWQQSCVESHLQLMLIPVTQQVGNVTTVTMQQHWYPVCDQYAPVCVAGKDGTTTCPAQGMAARSGETGTGSTEGNSPVGTADASKE